MSALTPVVTFTDGPVLPGLAGPGWAGQGSELYCQVAKRSSALLQVAKFHFVVVVTVVVVVTDGCSDTLDGWRVP